MNSGSYLAYICIAIIWEIFKWMTNKACGLLCKYELARKIGSKVYEFHYKSIVYKNLMKLYLESYLDIVVMNVLQIYAWINYPQYDFWRTPERCFSQVCTITHLFLMIGFPMIGGF
jgi:hypothetical protein